MIIIPKLSTNYSYPKECKQYTLNLYEKGEEIGESIITISSLTQIINNGKQLNTVARYHIEDMHWAFSALNKHPVFASFSLDNPALQSRTPIVVYLARIYINPKFRGKGFATEFLKQLPGVIEMLAFAPPLAITVMISPQSYKRCGDTNIAIPARKIKQMKRIMKHTFKVAGYVPTSIASIYHDCLCWVDPNFS